MRESTVFEAVPVGERITDDDDIQNAFDSWVDGLRDSESPGSIRAFRVPLDSQGQASHSAGGQVRLGTWPVDQFTFDTLCDKIVKEFMLPTESMMAVRLIGTMAGKSGVRFNKLVTLQRPNILAGPALPKDGVAEIMAAVNQNNERMFRLIQEMKVGGTQQEGTAGMMQTVAMMRALMEPMTSLMGPMMAAMAGRPLAGASPGGSMRETLETMMLMDKFLGRRGGGGGSSEPDWAKMVTAVGGVAAPLLQMAAQNRTQGTRTRRPQAQLANPTPAPVTSHVAQPTPVQPTMHTAPGVDLSQPSTLPPGSLAPGPNIGAPSTHIPTGGNSQETQTMFAETKKQIDALVDVARGGADPVAVANLFYDQTMEGLDDNSYSQLAATIESEGFISTIAIYNAQVKEYAEWFEKMRAQLVLRITDADSDPN